MFFLHSVSHKKKKKSSKQFSVSDSVTCPSRLLKPIEVDTMPRSNDFVIVGTLPEPENTIEFDDFTKP